jgi:hypothetical protein
MTPDPSNAPPIFTPAELPSDPEGTLTREVLAELRAGRTADQIVAQMVSRGHAPQQARNLLMQIYLKQQKWVKPESAPGMGKHYAYATAAVMILIGLAMEGVAIDSYLDLTAWEARGGERVLPGLYIVLYRTLGKWGIVSLEAGLGALGLAGGLLFLMLLRKSHRRNQRLRQGLCLRCGYDLRGNWAAATCPECGHPIPAFAYDGDRPMVPLPNADRFSAG